MNRNKGSEEKSFVFNALAIGLVFGDLGGGRDKKEGGSGLFAPLGIDIGLLLGWTFGIGKTFGLSLTPGIVIGRMGFIVVAISIHWQQKVGLGIVIPVFPVW